MKRKFTLVYGIDARPLRDQLNGQLLDVDNVDRFQAIADAMALLHIQGYLSESEYEMKRNKLTKQIAKGLEIRTF